MFWDLNADHCGRQGNYRRPCPPPRICTFQAPDSVNVTLHGKRDPADVIHLRILRRRDCPASCRWPRGITSVHMRGRQEGQSQRSKCNNRSGCQGCSPEPRMQAASRSWKRAGEQNFPLRLQKKHSLGNTLILAQYNPF